MDKIKQFVSFERVFLYGGLQDERGLPGVLIDIIIFSVLLVLFAPLAQYQGLVLALAILSSLWVKRCLRGRGKLYELMPVTPGFAATAIWAAPALVFVLGYLLALVLSIIAAFISPNLYISTISYYFFYGYSSFMQSFSFALILMVLLFFSFGSVLIQLKGKIAVIGFFLFAWAACYFLGCLNYPGTFYGDVSFAMSHIAIVNDILLFLVVMVLPLSIWLCQFLYKKRYSTAAAYSKNLSKFLSTLRVMLASAQNAVQGSTGGVIRLIINVALLVALIFVFMPYLDGCWIIFIAVPAALLTVDMAVNGGSMLSVTIPVSKKYAFSCLLTFSALASVVYYLISINIVNLAVFFYNSPTRGMPLNFVMAYYPGNTQISLMTVFLMVTLLFAGTALLMVRHKAVRIGGVGALTAVFYGFLCFYNIQLYRAEYTTSSSTRFFLFTIFKGLTVQNELLIYTAFACVVLVPLSIFIGYKVYRRRFPKEVKA